MFLFEVDYKWKHIPRMDVHTAISADEIKPYREISDRIAAKLDGPVQQRTSLGLSGRHNAMRRRA